MPIKRAKHMLQASNEVTEIRRRHLDALRRGHNPEVAIMIANGRLPENTPLPSKEIAHVAVDEDQTKFDFNTPVKEPKVIPLETVSVTPIEDTVSVTPSKISIPQNYQSLPWKDLQKLALNLSGKTRIASRMEAVDIIKKAQEE